MPHIHAETPREEITIAGQTFIVPRPYSEGHQLLANEAAALNQVFGENLRNNFASTVKSAIEAGTFDLDALQDALSDYAHTYEFGVRKAREPGAPKAPKDPVEAEAMSIAKDKVKAAIKAKGGSPKDYSAAEISELASQVLEKYPAIREIAARNVAANAEIAEIELGGDPTPPSKQKKVAAEA